MLNPWGLVVIGVGGIAAYVGIKGNQKAVWEMIVGGASKASPTGALRSVAALPLFGQQPTQLVHK